MTSRTILTWAVVLSVFGAYYWHSQQQQQARARAAAERHAAQEARIAAFAAEHQAHTANFCDIRFRADIQTAALHNGPLLLEGELYDTYWDEGEHHVVVRVCTEFDESRTVYADLRCARDRLPQEQGHFATRALVVAKVEAAQVAGVDTLRLTGECDGLMALPAGHQ